MDNKEKEFIKEVNMDKAIKKIIVCITLTLISLLSYVMPLLLGAFDFGFVFEIITLVFTFIAKEYIGKNDEEHARKYTIMAIIPIGWLFIYDLLTVLPYISDIADLTYLGIGFLGGELLLIANIMILLAVIKDIRKADNPEKHQEDLDWFYERPDEKKNIGLK